jgi:polyisoprenyl-phosphate glycosyltransferase
MKYSIVIPVYNSEGIVGETIERTLKYCREEKLQFELILINDNSTDNSWRIISEKARGNEEVVAIRLLRNYGQHVANLCGFRHATGDFIITMDDDLQNPPEEIGKLISLAEKGHDLGIGRFKEKKHSLFRRIGSRLVGQINKRIFNAPRGLILSNFRIIRKDVINRVCQHKTGYPYVPGMLLMYASRPANVEVEHQKRITGASNYNIWRILKLISEILFNYSSFPLRLVAGSGLLIALASFLLSGFYLIKGLFVGADVPGWTTVVVLLSFFNGMALLVLGMVGEYLVRLIRHTNNGETYHMTEIVGGE